MANPCITDTDCIGLSLDDEGNLRADLIISPDADNQLVCLDDGLFGNICPISVVACNGLLKLPDGLWAHKLSRNIAQSQFGSVTVGVSSGGGNITLQSGTQSIKNTGCAPALIYRNIAFGTTHVTAMTAGGRVELEAQVRIDGGPWNDYGFAVLQNLTGVGGLEHAWWPVPAIDIGFATLAAGATQSVEWRRRAEATSGSCTVNYQTVFMWTNVLSISGL
ncbi:MAG TPA: hypothetical protein VMW08_00175 [Acidimicrobiales bacterium]|nr:hypothetical protein [Acidimicrobiales bacterium]